MSPARSSGASLVLMNGRIASPEVPSGFAEALAAKGELIVAVGRDDKVRSLIGPRTQVVDLRGRLAIPAFGDAHIHPVCGALEQLQCNLYGLRARSESLEAVGANAHALPGDAWIVGGGWTFETFGIAGPTASELDIVSGGRPAFLVNTYHHSAWVNSAALALAGIDRNTGDPSDGRIERDFDGKPTGTLHDGAMRLVAELVPPPSRALLVKALLNAQAYLHLLGVTSWHDAAVGRVPELGIPDTFEAYRQASADGLLTARVVGTLWWDRHRHTEQIPDLVARREEAPAGRFRATAVKVMVDGICETRTAAMSRPYRMNGGAPGNPEADSGTFFIEPACLAEVVSGLDAEGFQIHFHTIGDAAVTATLDALEGLRSPAARRHQVAHVQFVKPNDLDRFARLGAVANCQPLWACNDSTMVDLTLPIVDPEQATWQFPTASLSRRGVPLAFGSDWPVSSCDPLQQIHVAVNRRLSNRIGRPVSAETDRPFMPEEAVGVVDAVSAFTHGMAFINHDEGRSGALASGRLADVAVLDQDIFNIPIDRIGETSVVMTIAGGQVVYGDE